MGTKTPMVVIATVSEQLELFRYLADEAMGDPHSVTTWLIKNFLGSPLGMIPMPLDF